MKRVLCEAKPEAPYEILDHLEFEIEALHRAVDREGAAAALKRARELETSARAMVALLESEVAAGDAR